MKSAIVQARISPELKNEGDAILSKLGISRSQAINAFYAQIVCHQGLPFEMKIPNAKTILAMKEAESDNGQTYNNLGEILREISEEK